MANFMARYRGGDGHYAGVECAYAELKRYGLSLSRSEGTQLRLFANDAARNREPHDPGWVDRHQNPQPRKYGAGTAKPSAVRSQRLCLGPPIRAVFSDSIRWVVEPAVKQSEPSLSSSSFR